MKRKPQKPVQSEKLIQNGIIEWLKWQEKRLNLYWFRAGVGSVKLESGRFFKTGRPGLPDIIVLWQGRFYGLEVKTSKGRQSDAQKEAERQIIACGGYYHIVRSIADVKGIFDDGVLHP